MVDEAMDVLTKGGVVSPFLLVSAGLVGYGLTWRWWTMRGPVDARRAKGARGLLGRAVAAVAAADPHPTARRVAVGPFATELDSYRVLISTLCVLAPLAGLLGTVSGMIVTFDGLATGSMYSRGGGIAGGISEALYSTEMGLVVAVPGIVLGRLLDRKQRVLVDQLERLVAEGAP